MTEVVNPLAADLDYVLSRTGSLWEELRGQRVFITGGTGFFGCWLLESLAWASDRLGLGVSAVVLTRNVEAFARKAPHLASHPCIAFHSGDVRSFEYPSGEFSHIIHAATEASAKPIAEDPLRMLDTIIQGTRHTLDFALSCGARRFLLTSSGAVYGKQPPNLSHMPEDYRGAPDTMDPGSVYGEGKRVAELLCSVYSARHGLETKIARCFAFVGPYLPLDVHFAIGNFIRDAMRGGPIVVKGDGTPYRSYLYAADLVVWLWTILLKGAPRRPYNVGSEQEITIGDLARAVARTQEPEPEVRATKEADPGHTADRYVPSVCRAGSELGLRQGMALGDSIARTMSWSSCCGDSPMAKAQ